MLSVASQEPNDREDQSAEEAGGGGPASGSLIDVIVREGAQRMLAAALQAEVEAYVAAFTGERDEAGHRLVVRNGSAQPRQVLTSAGSVGVRAPRVDDRRVDEVTGERRRFSTCAPPTRSSPPSPQCVIARRSPAGPAPRQRRCAAR